MKSSRSAGVDGLSMKLVKKVFKELGSAILRIINQSIATATDPSSLKTAMVLPLYKVATPSKPFADPNVIQGYKYKQLHRKNIRQSGADANPNISS